MPRDPFENSTLGVILEWALVFGKWSVILTQLVVMGAFLWRFTLDRNLTDLRKSIAKDVAVIKSYEQIERDYVLAQKQIEQAKTAIDSQEQILKVIETVAQSTPSEIWYDRISLNSNSLNLTAYAGSLPGFGQYLTAIQSNPLFSSVRIGKLETSTVKGAQMQFDLTATLGNPKPATGVKK